MTGEKTATISTTHRKYINRLKKLYENNNDEFTYYVENKDGSICAKIPPRQMSDEQRHLASERFRRFHQSGLSENL